MSARFFKVFSGVLLFHLILLNVVWVGFSAPMPRPPATFTYQGALPAGDTGSEAEDVWQKGKVSDQFTLDHLGEDHLNHWVSLRDPSKSSTYAHLGF